MWQGHTELVVKIAKVLVLPPVSRSWSIPTLRLHRLVGWQRGVVISGLQTCRCEKSTEGINQKLEQSTIDTWKDGGEIVREKGTCAHVW